MNKLDIEIKELEIYAVLATASHIQYLKTRGNYGASIWETFQEWETNELSGDKSKQSTLNILPFEVYTLGLIVKELKQEAERMANEEEKENDAV